MPRFLMNWVFDDVVSFLEQHFFIHIHTRGSHYYYEGQVDGRVRVVEVQFHANKAIKPRSLKHDIIVKSGIPEKYWKDWAQAGNKKARKLVQYRGAISK